MKLGMLFPGYGSQSIGMAKELYDESRLVQEYFEEASNCLNVNFVKLCFASSDVELSQIPDAYTANFLVSSALAALLKSEGIEPSMVAGYNLGEYAAVGSVGGFTLPDGLYLLNKFAGIYQAALPTLSVGMLQITGVSTTVVEKLCKKVSTKDEKVTIALYVLPNECLVGGHSQAIDRLRDALHEQQPQALVENALLEHGLHSSLMDDVVKDFTMYLEKVDFKDLSVPFVSGVDGLSFEQGDRVKQHVLEHINSPVLWPEVLKTMSTCDILVEIGQRKQLVRTVNALYPEKKVYTINTRADIATLKQAIADAQPLIVEEQKQEDREQ
jgi:[acyl-carrier-protein] S-malonyltransferase